MYNLLFPHNSLIYTSMHAHEHVHTHIGATDASVCDTPHLPHGVAVRWYIRATQGFTALPCMSQPPASWGK